MLLSEVILGRVSRMTRGDSTLTEVRILLVQLGWEAHAMDGIATDGVRLGCGRAWGVPPGRGRA